MDIPMHKGSIIRSFPNIKVNINITKPFPLRIWTLIGDSKSWIHLCYEKLQNIYFNYGTKGHDIRSYASLRLFAIKMNKFGKYDY